MNENEDHGAGLAADVNDTGPSATETASDDPSQAVTEARRNLCRAAVAYGRSMDLAVSPAIEGRNAEAFNLAVDHLIGAIWATKVGTGTVYDYLQQVGSHGTKVVSEASGTAQSAAQESSSQSTDPLRISHAALLEALKDLWLWSSEQRVHLETEPVPDGLGASVLAALDKAEPPI